MPKKLPATNNFFEQRVIRILMTETFKSVIDFVYVIVNYDIYLDMHATIHNTLKTSFPVEVKGMTKPMK